MGDPLSKKELDKQNTYKQAVIDRLKELVGSGPQQAPAEPVPQRPAFAPQPLGGANPQNAPAMEAAGMKRGGRVKKFAKGGSIDGIAQRGKTRGKYI